MMLVILEFPRSLYNHETLEKLILWNCVLIDAPSRVCLKSLRTLHLHHIKYEDSVFANLLSGCSNLKNLVVSRNLPDSKIFTIAVPSLQTLTISNAYNWRGDGYVVNAPCLKYLKIQGFKRLPFRLIEIASELVEATIMDSSITIDKKLLGSLTSVKSLSLISSPLKITLSTGSVFYRLVYLELSTHIAEWWNLLFLMLDSSPKLQVLKLISRGFCGKEYVAFNEWNQPENVSECLLLHLETFLWFSFKEQHEEAKQVAKYILRNANHLKRAIICVRGLNSDERLEMLEELGSVVWPSNPSCKLRLLSECNFSDL